MIGLEKDDAVRELSKVLHHAIEERNNVNILRIETDYVFCVGDIHGDFNLINYTIKQFDMKNSTLIFCGDCGFGFNKPYYYIQEFRAIETVCAERNCNCVFIRGNHDDPNYFDGWNINTLHLHLVPDYTVLQLVRKTEDGENLKNILCVGGGISVDRSMRIEKTEQRAKEYMRYHGAKTLEEAKALCPQTYWKHEAPYFYKEKLDKITDKGINIEYVCTHTCPSFCEPVGKDGITSWLEKDKSLEKDLNKERGVMDMLYEYLKDRGHNVHTWCYGHYHFHSSYVIDNIKFYLLDMSKQNRVDMIELH